VFQLIVNHPYLSALLGIYVLLWLFCLASLVFRPLWLQCINDVLAFEPRLKSQNVELTVPLRYLLAVGFFNYHSRVLDAWVKQHIAVARKNFSRIDTFEERKLFIDIQVTFEDTPLDSINARHLRSTFDAQRFCLLISGEGGAGKTSLACQLATWAMDRNNQNRLGSNLMIPLLIEHNFAPEFPPGKDPFLEAIRGRLMSLIDEPSVVRQTDLNL
jgi:hypothetical protein